MTLWLKPLTNFFLKMTELKEAKDVIIKHLDEICNVKNTKWVYNDDKEEYEEVDAGYDEKSMRTIRNCHYRDHKKYFKLRDLLEDLI